MNKNVRILASLYDQATKHLAFLVEKVDRQNQTLEAVQAHVRWIGDLGRTLLVVNQIEGARSSSDGKNEIPAPTVEKTIEPKKPII